MKRLNFIVESLLCVGIGMGGAGLVIVAVLNSSVGYAVIAFLLLRLARLLWVDDSYSPSLASRWGRVLRFCTIFFINIQRAPRREVAGAHRVKRTATAAPRR